MLDRQESDVAPGTSGQKVDSAVVEELFVGGTGFSEGASLVESVHRWRRPVEELDVTERSNRIEISCNADANLDCGFDIDWFGPADCKHAAASEAEIEERDGQTLVVDVVGGDASRTICDEYGSQLGEQLDHHLARIECTRIHRDSVCGHETDSIARSAAYHAHRERALDRDEP